MSKKSKIFTYGQGKRDLKFSKFDMSFSNTRSSVFGRLDPVAVYETLPADFWNVGSDGVTLLKPLAAPAFTDIKQHHYAYHVRNSAIWKHWNDFITNGTAYSGVYGSNASNQDNDNPWRIPAINAPYLAQICKLGSGWGVPYFKFTHEDFESPNSPFNINNITRWFHNLSSTEIDATDFFSLYFRSTFVISDYGYSVANFLQTHFIRASVGSGSFTLYFAGTDYTYSLINHYLTGVSVIATENSNDDTIGSSFSVSSSSVNSQYVLFQKYIDVMYFYDDAISECRLNDSPFIFTSHYFTNSKSEKVFDFVRRFSLSPIKRGLTLQVPSSLFYTGSGRLTDYLSVDNSISGRRFKIFYGSNKNEITNLNLALSASQIYWAIPAQYFGYSDDNSDLNYLDSIASSLFDSIVPWIGFSQNDDRKNVDNTLSVFNKIYYSSVNSSQYPDSALTKLGYSHQDFVFYLARNSMQLLESLNIPVASLATRSFFFYRYERFNSLIFFAYSKIWDDFYRNTVVSSPELNWSESNGDILVNQTFKSYLLDSSLPQPERFPEEFEGSDLNNYKLNGWVVPFHASPKNSISELQHYRDFESPDSSFKIRQYLENSQHYLRIDDMAFVFHFLTGFDLDSLVISQLYRGISEVPESLNTFSFRNFFVENFYLPSYYNGLLHYKYQNFNKDYFSSAMLDPMSGANQVLQGSTVNDLRVAEAKQSWFEKIAPKRSVEGFMETIFGIKPVLDNCQPTFLGSDHQRINIGEVIQTSSSTDTSPQGQRVGIGGARGGSGLVHGKCNEHGFLIILSSFTVESQYQTAFEKKWIVKNSYMDYPTLDFSNIGNESILMKEINFDGHGYVSYKNFNQFQYDFTLQSNAKGLNYGNNSARRVNKFQRLAQPTFSIVRQASFLAGTSLNNVFGYIPRYSSYKFKFDEVHGDFRETLDFWTTFRKFHSMPLLSHDFVNWEYMAQENDLKRLFVVTDDTEDEFNVSTHFTSSVDRALPYVCVPSSK